MTEEDYDVMKLALEELQLCRELGIKPISWEFGTKAYSRLIAKAFVLLPYHQPTDELPSQALLYGLPLAVNATVNPWAVTLIKSIA